MLSAIQTGRSGRTCSDGLADGRHSRLIKRDWPDPRPSTAGRSGRRAADGEQGILHTTAADKEKADKKQKNPKACRFFSAHFRVFLRSDFCFLFSFHYFSFFRISEGRCPLICDLQTAPRASAFRRYPISRRTFLLRHFSLFVSGRSGRLQLQPFL